MHTEAPTTSSKGLGEPGLTSCSWWEGVELSLALLPSRPGEGSQPLLGSSSPMQAGPQQGCAL